MDDNLGTSLYGGDTPGESIKPDFEKSGGAADKLSKAENAAAGVAKAALAAKGGGAGAAGGVGGAGGGVGAGGAKNAAKDGLKSGAEKAEANEQNPKGLYNKDGGEQSQGEEEPKLKMSKGAKTALKAAAPFAILLIFLFAMIAFLIALPVLMIGAIDYNLMKVLGFENTIAILEKVGSFVTAEFMTDGDFPSEYASALANNGVDVGQVLANGDFIKTNSYIANADTRDDLVAAAGDFSYISDDEGELAMLYDGKIIRADDFVAAVESDPVFYAAYSGAADIGTKYYYGEDVSNVYKEMGLSRGNFNDWENTGNYTADEERYFEILNKVLDQGSDIAVGGAHDDAATPAGASDPFDESDDNGGTYAQDIDGVDASSSTSSVAENTQEYVIKWWPHEETVNGVKKIVWGVQRSDNSTQRAANLLNTAVSSGEPYLASSAFISIEEPIQRARVDGSGPVNEVMNTLSKGTEVSYQNVETGSIETSKKAILETKNFRAAVSDSKYSKEEAQNFGRDRVLKTTGQADQTIIKKTTVATPGKVDSNSVVRNGKKKDMHADTDVISRANENIELSQAQKNSESFQSVIGGNRIIEGGSFLSNTINMHSIGAMPSDSNKIDEYHKEVEVVTARRAEADRATRSPFDITSPNTFLGSIVHNMATSILVNYGSGLTVLSAVTSAGNTAGRAVANLTGSAIASGDEDEYTTMSGMNCKTVNTVGVEGDLYCTSHNTPSTRYISYTLGDFKGSEIGGEIGDDGQAVEGSGLYEFVHYGMDRYATVGVKNAEVCERYREDTGYTPPGGGVWSSITNFFKEMLGTYDTCSVGVDDEDNDIDLETRKIYTGAKYTFGSEGQEKNALYSSYVMYNQVHSLLTGEKSVVAKVRDAYREKHPLDNSEAGVVARRSGMTKHEAEIALAYADYLDMIANYNPAGRFDFVAPVVLVEKPILEKQSDDVALNLYAWYSKETEYSDLRTRNFVV